MASVIAEVGRLAERRPTAAADADGSVALQAKVISIDVQAGSPDETAQQRDEPRRILVGHSLGAACAAAEIIDHPEV